MNIKKKSKKIQSRQKPIEYDIHLKYVCQQCGQHHWLSFNEASTNKFKIVCDCGHIFGVKRVKDFKLLFHKKPAALAPKTEPQEKPVDIQVKIATIPDELLEQVIPALVTYGFTKKEAKDMATASYAKCVENNPVGLVKKILESLRSNNVN